MLLTQRLRSRNQELEQLSSASAPDDLNDFHVKLKKGKGHHHKYPDGATNGFTLELNILIEGEESFGRDVDLNTNHTEYNNLKHAEQAFLTVPSIPYNTSRSRCPGRDGPAGRGAERKNTVQYLTNLHLYLSSFIRPTRPLQSYAQQQLDAEAEFNKLWEQNQIQGWDASGSVEGANGTPSSEGIWCSACELTACYYHSDLTSKCVDQAKFRNVPSC
ncbi:hypothetical protein RSAG8_02512, partial [Rhizoctonia solani AG-8 WAC10335]